MIETINHRDIKFIILHRRAARLNLQVCKYINQKCRRAHTHYTPTPFYRVRCEHREHINVVLESVGLICGLLSQRVIFRRVSICLVLYFLTLVLHYYVILGFLFVCDAF